VSYLGDQAKLAALRLLETLHNEQIGALFTPGDRSLKAQLKAANRISAAFALILGEDEVQSGQVTVRDMTNGEQTRISLADVPGWLKDKLR
jgi:histidyl-tRNA synthetase